MPTIDLERDLTAIAQAGGFTLVAVLKDGTIQLQASLISGWVGSESIALPASIGKVVALGAVGPTLVDETGETWVWYANKQRWTRPGSVLSPKPTKKRIRIPV